MEREKLDNKDNTESDNDEKSRAFKILEQRMEKHRRKASTTKLITYIVALIMVIILMLWLRSKGM
ncbi:hypothetical protein GF312_07270 [Candidatus Poribacteria bacterium]|nr:hypothetical protein [Candidatus Poribacteria bacterium]